MSSADMTPPTLPPEPDAENADPSVIDEPSGGQLLDSAPGEDHPGGDGSDPPTDSDGSGGKRKRRWWFWGIGFLIALGLVLAAVLVPTPYVLIQPGAVRPAEARVSVEGTKTYPNEGAVLFTTVYVDDATLFGLARGALDDAIEVRSADEVYGNKGRDQTRKINRREMDLSKLIAEREALTYLGFQADFTADGVRVLDVAEDVPADGVLRPDDVITSVDGAAVSDPSQLRDELAPHAPGDTVEIGIKRSKLAAGESASSSGGSFESTTVDVELAGAEPDARGGTDDKGASDDGTASDDAAEPRAVLGVTVEPFNPRVESDVDVQVDSGAVTGPSAGLAWSLAIVDVLTPGSLTGDKDVAVTGEILPDGSVGVIGGTAQKTATVVRNGVDVFMYPAATPQDEQAEMRRIAGDDVKLVPVASLDEAIDYLVPGGVKVDHAHN